MSITDELDALEAAEKKAPRAPWEPRDYDDDEGREARTWWVMFAFDWRTREPIGTCVPLPEADARFIADARNALPILLSEIRLLRDWTECPVDCEYTPGGQHTGECLLRPDRKLGQP